MLVIKIGGSVLDRCEGLLDELAAHNEPAIVLHGFGPQTTDALEAQGIEPRFVTSPSGVRSRFTDTETLAVLTETARGLGRDLTERIRAQRARTTWLDGTPLFRAEVKPALRHVHPNGKVLLIRGNRSGRVAGADPAPVEAALARGAMPVITPLGHDAAGPVSIDGDRAAAVLGGATGARTLLVLTDVPGYLSAYPDEESRVATLRAGEIEALLGRGAKAGMVRKLVACREALAAGAGRALLASALGERPIARALAGEATEVIP